VPIDTQMYVLLVVICSILSMHISLLDAKQRLLIYLLTDHIVVTCNWINCMQLSYTTCMVNFIWEATLSQIY